MYWASNEYILPDNASAGELVLLPYDKSRRLSFLKKFDHSQIAVKVIKGGCASSGGSAYLVVRQGGQKLPSEVRLYVNSLGATDVHASFSGETPRPCRAVKGRRTFFDHECELEWPRDKLNTEAEVVVEREMHGRKLPRASMNVEYVFKP